MGCSREFAMNTAYEKDVIAWANEQAAFIRAGNWSALDLEHLAEEIEDVGKSEKRELSSRMAVLLAHLLKWQYQPEKRGRSWTNTIHTQRKQIELALEETSSLKASLSDPKWQLSAWLDARTQSERETGIEDLPMTCPWTMDQVLTPDWLPAA